MKKNFKICYVIDLVKSLVELFAGAGLVLLGSIQLSNASSQEERLPAAGLVLLGVVLLAICFCAFYWLSSFKREHLAIEENYDSKIVFKYGILATIFAQMPTAVYSLLERNEWEKKQAIERPSASNELYGEERPVYAGGYNQETRTIVRVVPTRSTKAYQTRGIEDIGAKNNWKGWLYLAPVIILVAIFLIYPLVNTIFISFTENYKYASGTFDGMTLKNFTYILGLTDKSNGAHEAYFVRYAIPNTLLLVIVTVPVSTVLALLIAVALNSIKWLQKILQTIFFLPYVTNAIAVGMVFSVIFDDHGIINYLFHTDTVWIFGAQQYTAMVPLVLYIVWSSIPFKILIFLSGLQGIDKQYYQAAQIDAAPRWKVLTRVTVPLLSPQILYILITSFIGAWKEYTSVVGLFNGPGTRGKAGDPNMETIVYYIYENLNDNTSAAAAAAVFLFVIILAFTGLQFLASKKRVHY
ncbi:MAG: sugar ABC transporter permease [Bacilli bacterium]|nr:sugar ABC transporter permease [Bacilli bacterium]